MQDVTKSTIAKLLATENITVVQDQVRTASFDVKHRILTLPMWADIATSTQDHLIGHEVGHALYTPLDGWHDATCGNGPAFKTFLNVIEDARIEKLIQRKYPGLRTTFIKSYKHLLESGFFGADLDHINSGKLIDRINTYFKCGGSAGVTAIVVGITTYIPNYQLQLRIFGYVKLWKLAGVFILFDLISLAGGNGGGHIAHIGGALFGYFYVSQSSNNSSNIFSWFSEFFSKRKKPLQTVYKSTKKKNTRKSADDKQAKIDSILDKISKTGYETLTKEEKEFLFKQSN